MKVHNRWHVCRMAAVLLFGAALAACGDDEPGLLPAARSAPPAGRALSFAGLCASSEMNRGLNGVHEEIDDYGRALYDADENPAIACIDSAAVIMTQKIHTTLNADPTHFGSCTSGACGFNAGAVVALMFAAADRISSRGGMTVELDAALRRVEGAYAYNDVSDGCTLQSTDNCMDGHAVAASGYAWIAAYRYLRRDPESSIQAARAAARAHITATFDSACIFNGFGQATLCKEPSSSVAPGDSTKSFNLGHQHIPYGFGLMTSIATAAQAYGRSGAVLSFLPYEKTIAVLLFEEAQRAIENETFRTVCPYVTKTIPPGQTDSVWVATGATAPCGGHEGYQAQMYALNKFYVDYIETVPTIGTYRSTAVNTQLFTGGFFSWGRLETYDRMASDWLHVPNPIRQWTNNYTPHGSVESIGVDRWVSGWACDRDVPDRSVRVTLTAPGRAPIHVRTGRSASADGTACFNGGAYPFSVQLPADWAGLTVSASVKDYFGQSSAPLACSSCVVPVPVTPTVSVAWAYPSAATWGPANTLTVAGHAQNGSGTVQVQWKDVSAGTDWVTVSGQSSVDSQGQWFNTVPTDNYCRTYQVRAIYSGVTSAPFTFTGSTAGFCTWRIIWVQPSSRAGIGAPGSLVVAGEARGAGSSRVTLWSRDITANGPWVREEYEADMDPNGIWINEIHNADPYHQYEVWIDYDVVSDSCNYAGTNDITWC